MMYLELLLSHYYHETSYHKGPKTIILLTKLNTYSL